MWRNTDDGYGLGAILLHWIVAALFLVQLPLGYLGVAAEDTPALQLDLYWWHKSVGFVILAISLVRVLWVLSQRQPALGEDISPSERSAAKWAHVALYLATLGVPMTGWAVVSTAAPVDAESGLRPRFGPAAAASGVEPGASLLVERPCLPCLCGRLHRRRPHPGGIAPPLHAEGRGDGPHVAARKGRRNREIAGQAGHVRLAKTPAVG